MGIRITMENKMETLERRIMLLEGAVEDLLDIYKESKNGKKKKLSREKASKETAIPKTSKQSK